ncbi:hypothetical protein [Modicisalibacter luteus]|uniref:Uncharacterized protein n=1 Tax=Modicisalibacter luteus TaxID=453962 RepID=A0ABV7LXW7_9GAMM|nr:hypothetical protein [Halomonas lutea]GHB14189.1 hypothetical protein GCM10007159_40700 [Halomonas lutea]
MPTPEWRYEKAERVVKALCRGLAEAESETLQGELAVALHDSLKLLCDAIAEETPSRGNVWTPAMVDLFREQPEKCGQWLALLNEPDFKPDYHTQ